VLLGLVNKVEIWQKNDWESFSKKSEEIFNEIGEIINEK
jgi:DNA-binding transcriptional regulator/RsmH inhibitor MraZ